jgi:hypothetical protein
MTRENLVSKIVEEKATLRLMNLLGWQGGTVHQVADELIERDLDTLPICQIISSLESEPEEDGKGYDIRYPVAY